jgi:hypothetical protein
MEKLIVYRIKGKLPVTIWTGSSDRLRSVGGPCEGGNKPLVYKVQGNKLFCVIWHPGSLAHYCHFSNLAL